MQGDQLESKCSSKGKRGAANTRYEGNQEGGLEANKRQCFKKTGMIHSVFIYIMLSGI